MGNVKIHFKSTKESLQAEIASQLNQMWQRNEIRSFSDDTCKVAESMTLVQDSKFFKDIWLSNAIVFVFNREDKNRLMFLQFLCEKSKPVQLR